MIITVENLNHLDTCGKTYSSCNRYLGRFTTSFPQGLDTSCPQKNIVQALMLNGIGIDWLLEHYLPKESWNLFEGIGKEEWEYFKGVEKFVKERFNEEMKKLNKLQPYCEEWLRNQARASEKLYGSQDMAMIYYQRNITVLGINFLYEFANKEKTNEPM